MAHKSVRYIVLLTLVFSFGLFASGMMGYKPVMDFILAGNVSSLIQFNIEHESFHRLFSSVFFALPGLIAGFSALWCNQSLKGRLTTFICLAFVTLIVMFIRVFFLRYELNSVSQMITSPVMLPVETIHLYTMGAYAGIAVFMCACIIRWVVRRASGAS